MSFGLASVEDGRRAMVGTRGSDAWYWHRELGKRVQEGNPPRTTKGREQARR